MGFKNWIRQGIGLAGKHLMNYANSATGGIAGKIFDSGVEHLNKHSGLIGKGLNMVGKKLLSDENRNKLTNFVDKALDYIPQGKVKDTLTKINDAAQGKLTINNHSNQNNNNNSIKTVSRQKRKTS